MHSPRPHAGLIILFLWICPLAGTSVFIGEIARGGAPPPFHRLDNHNHFLDLPGGGWVAIFAAALLVPFIIACITHRAKNFVAGISFVILLASIAGWIRSHYFFDDLMLCRLKRELPLPIVHDQTFTSTGGGISFRWRRLTGELAGTYTSVYFLALGENQSLSYRYGSAINRYPVDDESFMDHPQRLLRLGFAANIKPKRDLNPQSGGTLFALALPYWFICFLAVPLPLGWIIRHRRIHARVDPGKCRNCGYDLRATPDASGAKLPICPECGTASSAISTEQSKT